MKNLFQTAVENTPAQPQLVSQPSKQVLRSVEDMLNDDPNIQDILQVSDNGTWARFNVVDWDNKIMFKLVIKSESSFTVETKYLFSPSLKDANEFVGYPQFIYQVKGESILSTQRVRPSTKPADKSATNDQSDAIAALMEQNRVLMEKLSQQQPTAPAPKTTRKASAPKVPLREEDIPF